MKNMRKGIIAAAVSPMTIIHVEDGAAIMAGSRISIKRKRISRMLPTTIVRNVIGASKVAGYSQYLLRTIMLSET
jgi:hypothetical protein